MSFPVADGASGAMTPWIPTGQLRSKIESMRSRGVKLYLDGENIRYKAPAGAMTDTDKDYVRSARCQIMAYLAAIAENEIMAQSSGDARSAGPARPSPLQEMWWRWWKDSDAQFIGKVTCPVLLKNVNHAEKCVQILLDRHDALRTRFSASSGKLAVSLNDPKAFILEPDAFTTTESDGLKPREIYPDPDINIHLSDEWLVRARASEQPDGVKLTMWLNHIVYDATSLAILTQELRAIAISLNDERPLELSAPTGFYAYAERERRRSRDGHLNSAGEYWLKLAESMAGPKSLQSDVAAARSHGREYRRTIVLKNGAVTLHVDATARKTSSAVIAISTFLTAVTKTLRVERFYCTSMVDGRYKEENDKTVGMILDFDAFDARFDDNMSFYDRVDSIEDSILCAKEIGSLPASLLDAIVPTGLVGFNVMFPIGNAGVARTRKGAGRSPLESQSERDSPRVSPLSMPPIFLGIGISGADLIFNIVFKSPEVPADIRNELMAAFKSELSRFGGPEQIVQPNLRLVARRRART